MSQASQPPFGRTVAGTQLEKILGRYRDALALAVVACFAAGTLAVFHDHFWLPGADGAYAHIAERILAGEILNRDVQDIHGGYGNFVNALAMWAFGTNLVALRYPLAFLTLVQACLVFWLLRPKGTLTALAGGTAMAALTFVQFLNPSANWYALFLFVAIVGVLAWVPRESRWRLVALGFLLMTLFLFRQLTGVLAAIGVLTYLLGEAPARPAPAPGSRNHILARALLALMALGLAVYLSAKATWGAMLLFGPGPLGVIAWVALHASPRNRDTAVMLFSLSVGALAALAPLALYHVANGSVATWIDDTVMVAFSLTQLAFFEGASLINILLFSGLSVLLLADLPTLVNSAYWTALVLLAPVVGYVTLRALWRDGPASGTRPYLLPVLALFHALVAVHYETTVYLMYTAALTLAGLLWLGAAWPRGARWGLAALAFSLSAIGLSFHAGQPLDRSWQGLEMAAREHMVEVPALERAGLRIAREDAATYDELIALIRRETPANAAILALPLGPELYFLSGRRNPTRFFNSAFGVRSEDDLQAVLSVLRREPPALVFHRPEDSYSTDYTDRIMEFVRIRYEPLPSIADFEIYRYRPRTEIISPRVGAAP